MKTFFIFPKKNLVLLLFTIIFKFGYSTGEPSTYFNIFVPPNNDNVQRNVCLVVTAIYDSTSFAIVDDGMDGDTDDSKSGILMAGQSYILYIKDNGINDDAKYASGGILKQDGDYFIITSNKLIYASQSTNSDWQHDWVPAVSKSGIGQKFIVYAPKISSSNRDLNVFAYNDNTQITIRKISISPTIITGYTNVDINTSNIVVQRSINIGQDIIYSGTEGRNLMITGETYVVESDKPITLQYGSLFGNERDGGGYVPSANGSSCGDLFYFGVPYQSGTNGEQEIRIVSSNNANIVSLERYSSGNWLSVKTWTLNANSAVDWVGRNNGNVSFPTVFRVRCTAGNKVSVFEANWLETGNPGTSDIGTMCSSMNGTSSGNNFIVYLAPPGNEQNVLNPFTGSLFAQQLTHAYLFSFNDTCHVSVKDLYTNGGKVNRLITILPGRYFDCFFTLSEWKSIYNNTGTVAGGAERPYISITSDKPISVMNTNFNDNWMMYFGSALEQSFSQTSIKSKDSGVPGDTILISSSIVFKDSKNIDSAIVSVNVGSGLKVIDSKIIDNTFATSVSGNLLKNEDQTVVNFAVQNQLLFNRNYTVETKVIPQLMYNNGQLIPNNTVVSVETIVTGKVAGITQQSSASSGLKIESSNTSNLQFQLANFSSELTNSWNVSIVDADNDGFEDLYVTDKDLNKANLFYKNNGNNNFLKTSPNILTTELASSVCSTWGDINNDGWRDALVINNTQKPNSLILNLGNLNFQKFASSTLTDHSAYFHSGSFVDYDNDGWLDVFVSNFMPTKFNELYRNNKNGTFSKIETTPLSTESFMSLGATWADFDNDGDQDLFVPNSNNVNNSFFINNGAGNFTKGSSMNICNDLGNSVGSCWGDVNNDGWLDLFVSNASNQNNFLYINNKIGGFNKVTSGVVVNDGGHSHGCSFIDFDNDMDLDLYVTNDNGIKFLYLNDGTGNFSRKNDEILAANYGKSMGHSWFDADKDGDLDLFVATHSGQKNYYFVNNGNSNKWVNIKLVGSISNKDAIGARVSIKSGGIWQCREINSQSGLGGQSSIRCHFGLGTNANIDSIIIKWPSGMNQILTDETVNNFKTIYEPSGGLFRGTVFFDKNSNCQHDLNEVNIGNLNIDIDGQTLSVNSNGEFSTRLSLASHTISIPNQGYWISNCNNRVVDFNNINDTVVVDLPIFSNTNGVDLSVNLSATAMRKGFKNQVDVLVQNLGTETSYNANLKLILGNGMIIKNSLPNFSSNNSNIYNWDIDSLIPGQSKNFVLFDSVYLSNSIGTMLVFQSEVTIISDLDLSNNSVSKSFPVVGAIDPNDLKVSPMGEGDGGFIKKDVILNYTVRFQNTGNYYASNVVINDVISEGLDISKISNIISSHKFTYRVLGNRQIIFYFDNINLPDSTFNEEQSHGFISFSIPLKEGISEGYEIYNQADIQFDYEDPIVTNRVLNTVIYKPSSDFIILFPNPANDFIQLKLNSNSEKYQSGNSIIKTKVYNQQGQLIDELEAQNISSIDLKNYSDGIYLIEAIDSNGNRYLEKFIRITSE